MLCPLPERKGNPLIRNTQNSMNAQPGFGGIAVTQMANNLQTAEDVKIDANGEAGVGITKDVGGIITK